MSESEPRRTPEITPEILEIMSDPVRMRAYGLLRGLGIQKASALASRAAVSEAVMLLHLRVMREIGFVVDLDTGPERFRRWEAVPGGVRLTEAVGDARFDQAMQRWMEAYVQVQAFLLESWVRDEPHEELQWRHAAANGDFWMHLTASELDQLGQELWSVAMKWYEISIARRSTGQEVDDEVRPVYVAVDAVPLRPLP